MEMLMRIRNSWQTYLMILLIASAALWFGWETKRVVRALRESRQARLERIAERPKWVRVYSISVLRGPDCRRPAELCADEECSGVIKNPIMVVEGDPLPLFWLRGGATYCTDISWYELKPGGSIEADANSK